MLAELDALAERCRGAVVVTRRGVTAGESGERLDGAALGVRGGEWVEVRVGARELRVEFAGWSERLRWSDSSDGSSEGESDAEAREEAIELALDFVAAALFGELRVVEERLAGRVLRRSLEVCVDGVWRVHARAGALGFAGLVARVRGQLERRLRSNAGRLPRPASLADAGPSGLPRCPWSGAARSSALDAAAEIAIDGELDLHNFSPKEVAPLVREYIEVCRRRGIRDLRIVHGKGKGVLRRTVHSLLDEHEAVEGYRLGGSGEGSWGATIVRLRDGSDSGGAPDVPGA